MSIAGTEQKSQEILLSSASPNE